MAPAIAIEGPKGVGKTATARRRAASVWMLDDDDQRSLLSADLSFSNRAQGTTLIDEWQKLPQVWDAVRRQVDDHATPGSFLLTGSATPASSQGTHSGAGRILSLRMRPMALYERGEAAPTVSLKALLHGGGGDIEGTTEFGVADYMEAVEASGFPGITSRPELFREDLLEAYVQRVIDRDLPDLGFTSRRPEVLRRWLAAYAAASSSTAKYSEILDATTAGDGYQPTKVTTINYRDHLTQLWLLDPTPGWSPSSSPFARLQQAPKHQLADPALAARLLNLNAKKLSSSRGAHMAGPLFESLVTLTVKVAAQAARARVGHLRTRNGDREVDLIVEGRDGQVLGIEVKLAASVDSGDVKHLLWLKEQLKDDVSDLIVVTTGKYAYRREDGVAVVPLALLGA
ncbi:ATP-binding protein [Citricoccus muralis]|uniref:ATP-binding protein n=1 Tax=Citricoccus muralis TaxID=169134 RepID=UPI0032427448